MEDSTAAITTYIPRWDARLIWDIEDFEKILLPNAVLDSPHLMVENKSLRLKLIWQIALKTTDTELQMSLRLQPKMFNMNAETISCSFEMVMGEPTGPSIVEKGHETYWYIPESDHWSDDDDNQSISQDDMGVFVYTPPENPVIVQLKELTDQRKRICPIGTLRITINLHISMNHTTKMGARKYPGLEDAAEIPSGNDKRTASFYNNSLYSDVTIKCQNRTYPCHRLILGRSSVFAAMFSTPMKESNTKEILIWDMQPSVLEIFLKSLYFLPFEFPTDYKKVLELTDGAERYDLAALKAKCLRQLTSMITDENAGELNIAAQRYCQDLEYQQIFKNYCHKRQAILMKNPAYRRLFCENYEAFM